MNPTDGDSPTHDSENASKSGGIKETIITIVYAGLIALGIRSFAYEPFSIPSGSMIPTLVVGDYLFVSKLSYGYSRYSLPLSLPLIPDRILFSEPERGDVVILRYPLNPSTFFIKRIIGLPNETVTIKDGVVSITSKTNELGFTLDEPYIELAKTENHTKVLGDDEYFVMGDNRAASSDSRVWGAAPEDLIIGKAFLRLLPVSQAAVLPGAYNQL